MAAALLIAFVSILALGAVVNHSFYVNNVYEIDQQESILTNALSTNNLADKADYMTKVIRGLADYSGNPVWLYPVEHTDFDSIKRSLVETIRTTQELDSRADINSMSYQQSLSVVDSTIEEIQHRIQHTSTALNFNPYENPLNWGTIFGIMVFTLVSIVIADWRNAVKNGDYW